MDGIPLPILESLKINNGPALSAAAGTADGPPDSRWLIFRPEGGSRAK